MVDTRNVCPIEGGLGRTPTTHRAVTSPTHIAGCNVPTNHLGTYLTDSLNTIVIFAVKSLFKARDGAGIQAQVCLTPKSLFSFYSVPPPRI